MRSVELRNAIAGKLEQLERLMQAHPERRRDLAQDCAARGEPRPFPALILRRDVDIHADEVPERKATGVMEPEERLLEQLSAMIDTLETLNPITPTLSFGHGPGTLAASFGIQVDAELGYQPRGSLPLEKVLAQGMPDPEQSGFLPEIRRDIAAAHDLTPPWIKIGLPDMQGPFNIAHMILGDRVFIAPLEEPEAFHAFMEMITGFFLDVQDRICSWIDLERFRQFPPSSARICECSVNLVSAAFYRKHVLPYDRLIAGHFGSVAIHPCSGPHVFRVTLSELPVSYTEAGFVDRAAAGAISVDDALTEIGQRPVILGIGQELPLGREEAFIQRDLDRARMNSRLLFSYTGMHWKKSDDEMMRAMHQRLDDYWRRSVIG